MQANIDMCSWTRLEPREEKYARIFVQGGQWILPYLDQSDENPLQGRQ